jgi:hypothetical protein
MRRKHYFNFLSLELGRRLNKIVESGYIIETRGKPSTTSEDYHDMQQPVLAIQYQLKALTLINDIASK